MPHRSILHLSAGILTCTGLTLLLLTPAEPSARPQSSAPQTGTDSTSLLASVKPTNIFEPVKGAVSPDGRTLVYEQVDGLSRQLWRLDLATGSRKQLTNTPGVRYDPVWSLDGRQIAYSGRVFYPASGEELGGIWVIEGSGGAERLVYQDSPIDGGVVSNPSWTPDGRLLFHIFVVTVGPQGDDGGSPSTQLWRIGLDGRGLQRVSQGSARQELGMTSPDGERIAFVGESCEGKGQGLWIMNADGSRPICLVSVVSPSSPPHWSPDGSRLYLAALSVGGSAVPRDSIAGLFLVRMADGATTGVPTPSGEVLDVSVLADGKAVAMLYRPSPRIATVSPDGGRPVPVSTGELPALRPAWRPDGRALGFTRGVWQRTSWRTNWEVATVPLTRGHEAGTAQTFPGLPRGATDPAWSPDGTILAFASPNQDMYRAQRVDRAGGRSIMLSYGALTTANAPTWTPNGDAVLLPGGDHLNKDDSLHYLETGKNGILKATAVRSRLEDTTTWNAHLEAIPLEGFDGIAASPAVSPDGSWIAFGERWQKGETGVYIVPIAGGRVTRIASAGLGDSFGGPEWTADGRSVVFARGDGNGGFQLIRVPWEGGAAEPITPIDVDVLHPRRSPDGRTFAVTLWSAPTEFRLVSAIGPSAAARKPMKRPPAAPPASARASDLWPAILAFAQLVVRTADTVAKTWPLAWSPEQSFVLVAPEARQTVVVAPAVPFAGAVPVAPAGLPANLQGRTFLVRDTVIDPRSLGLPSVSLASLPSDPAARRAAEEKLLTGLYHLRITGSNDPEALTEEEWHLPLPRPSLENAFIARSFSHEPRTYGCPLGDAASCAAMVMLEQRLLRDALKAPPQETRARLRDYVAVRWVRMLGDFNARRGELPTERGFGAAGYVARRAALLATGGSVPDYEAELSRALSNMTGGEPTPGEQTPRLRATAAATALLLDRLHVPWHPSAGDSASLFDLVSRASGFDSVMALPSLTRAMQAYDYPALVTAARSRATKAENPAPWLQPAFHLHRYYARALEALNDSVGVKPLVITLRTGQNSDTLKVRLRIEPGRAGMISAGPGYEIYPDARRVQLEVGGLSLDLQNCPVALDPKAYNSTGLEQITLYPAREFRDRIKEQKPLESGPVRDLGPLPLQEVRIGPSLFRAGPSVQIGAYINGVFVDPWIYWLSRSRARRPPSSSR